MLLPALLMRALEYNDFLEVDAGPAHRACAIQPFIFRNNISEFIDSAHET